ncbi:unnamed protein product [Medioppia subpectinata]|uniref:Translation initiation factor eIF2B subunit delta n=1 Tax=Medioppia subpectinata TaxID=1979941 RepID=A0A7R9L119_9ACAR|nr:unnamed protein product [Medioppia subpectinata]CAG2112336.1 unnamed protein product [Medioppia subpectinata]
MTNAVKFLKLTFSRIPAQTNDSTAKTQLCEAIDDFIYDEVICAQRGIAEFAITKVHDNDVILTFGCSLIVKHVIYNAIKKGKQFRVVVVDSRPRFDGKEMLKFLLKHNIPVIYIYINAISYVMKEVTKVLLGAHSLLANGYVMSHIGSSQIALVAQAFNVPVLVCCETYKFSERVHTDSFVHNEIGDSTDLLNSLSNKSHIDVNNKDLNFLDLLYDVTPHELVSVVITEKGVLPCTSAPAVLRVRETK